MLPTDHPLASSIKALIPINGLEVWLQDEVLEQGELVEFKKRSSVFKEGDDDPYTLFLVQGELSLRAGDSTPTRLSAGDDDALRAVAQLRPRRYTAQCSTPVTMFRIRRAVLEHILSDGQVSKEGSIVTTDGVDESDDSVDWMSHLLASELFTRLPPDHMQRFFVELEPVPVAAGEAVVEQGSAGDYLYIVAEGACSVVRKARGSSREQELARLGVGDVFGEEALISESPRNATVRALTDGMMMRLAKASFEELVSKPVLRPVAYSEAEQLVSAGAIWIDVRFPEEFASRALPGAINVPLNLLRLQLDKLDTSRTYITYCDSGGRASTAAFLMMRNRIDAKYLAGGLLHSPFGTEVRDLPPSDSAPAPIQTSPALAPVEVAPAARKTKQPARKAAAPEEPSPAPQTTPATAPAPAHESAATVDTVLPQLAQAHAVEIEALGAELKAHQGQLADERQRHERAQRTLQHELQTLRLDRDAQAARSAKAIHAARELKSQADETRRALNAAQAKRQRLIQTHEQAAADARRATTMEQLRLQQELQSAEARTNAERTRFAEELKAAEAQHSHALDQLRVELIDAQQAHDAALATHEAQIAQARDEADSASARGLVLEAEASASNSRIEVLEARFEVTRQTIMAQESELQSVSRKAEEQSGLEAAEVDAEREALTVQRGELEQQRNDLERERAKARAEAHTQQAELTRHTTELHAQRERLAKDRTEFSAHRETEQKRFNEATRERQDTLSAAEQRLRDDEQGWLQRVADAVAEERNKLAHELADVEQAMAEFDAERDTARNDIKRRLELLEAEQNELASARSEFEQAQAQAQANHATALADLEAREQRLEATRIAAVAEHAESQAQAEEHLRSLQEQAQREVASVTATSERRLAEQSALLADERRQLENQTVRLNEALAAAAPRIQPKVAPKPAPAIRQAPAALPEQRERQRVMSPKQLTELRKRMAEKMAAAKA
jgi:CRP-like cAMP-binding protein